MALPYVITEACLDTKDKGCVAACPVQCIYELVGGTLQSQTQDLTEIANTHPAHEDLQHIYGERMLYINPDECTSCDACVTECPVDAIYPGDKVPEAQAEFTDVNRLIFADITG
jgi:ferredoxin